MTSFTRKVPWVVCGWLVLCSTGCERTPAEVHQPEVRQPRPIAGDTVVPELLPGNTWKPEGPVLLSVRLQVQGDHETEPGLLQLEDVPYKIVPRVNLTFYQDEKEILQLNEHPMTRDC